MRDDRMYLDDIFDCISRIEAYTVDGHDVFMSNRMIQDAVTRNFEIIGEATKCLSSDFRQANPSVPWKRIAGFRDVLIHDYVRIDPEEVWGIIENFLPELKLQIVQILNNLA